MRETKKVRMAETRIAARELAKTASMYQLIGKTDVTDAPHQETTRHWEVYRSLHTPKLPEPIRQIIRKANIIRKDGE